jgi:hypothetical protein
MFGNWETMSLFVVYNERDSQVLGRAAKADYCPYCCRKTWMERNDGVDLEDGGGKTKMINLHKIGQNMFDLCNRPSRLCKI